MKLEQQVISLEIAKKLKSLNVKQESLFAWFDDFLNPFIKSFEEKIKWENTISDTGYFMAYPAFTVAELGELLPQGCASYRNKKGNWDCVPPVTMQHLPTIKFMDTEADARGNMLIYLIEHNLITP